MPLSKILLVDDDENIRTIALLSLEDDYQVEVATSGLSALEIAGKNRPPPLKSFKKGQILLKYR